MRITTRIAERRTAPRSRRAITNQWENLWVTVTVVTTRTMATKRAFSNCAPGARTTARRAIDQDGYSLTCPRARFAHLYILIYNEASPSRSVAKSKTHDSALAH
jgi:hypothetical protein